MNLHTNEQRWRCYFCGYEEINEGRRGVEEKREILESPEPQEMDTEWQKKCPMCGGRMNVHAADEMWICYSCAYEESKEGEVQGKSEEKREHSDAPKPTPAPDPFPDLSPPHAVISASQSSHEQQKSKKGSSPAHSQPSGKKKTCPVCRKKMNWYQEYLLLKS